ncbi:MAG: hypothetical protein QGF16_12530 [Rhodospirillales bacterium]|nr:hypothetical protein [Rhodospirillales bacterium]
MYQRGLWHLWRLSGEDLDAAIDFFDRAEQADPGFAQALAARSYAHTATYVRGFRPTAEELQLAYKMAVWAVEIDDDDYFAHWALGVAFNFQRNHDIAIDEIKRSIALNSSFAPAHAQLAGALVFFGHGKEAHSVWP